MTKPEADVIVIGGGPAGTTAATLIARAGHDVSLFEMRTFPRFQVGESLVPAVNLTLAELGVLDQLDQKGFPRKYGVQFVSRKGPSRPFYFSESGDERLHSTWQVLRSDFDDLLLRNAEKAGVVCRTGTAVTGVVAEADGVSGVVVKEEDGHERIAHARIVIDASGQRGLLARQLGRREHIAGLENAAVYAHYQGVRRDTGIDAGSTIVYRVDAASWIWLIPLPDVVSIGLVAPARRLSSHAGSPADVLDEAIASCESLSDRMTEARASTEVRVVRDFSYRAQFDGGPGWLLVGDALGFIDPVYSTGLYLSLLSAELGAAAVTRALANGPTPPNLAGFSDEYRVAFDRLLSLVRAFYREGFQFGELARHPTHRQGLIDLLIGNHATGEAVAVSEAIERLLAGDGNG